MNVFGHLRLGQRVELAPIPDLNGSRADLDRELPVGCLNARRRSRCQNRKILNEVLTRRDTVRVVAA